MKQKKKSAEMRSMGEHAYFAASNAASGFRSYYGETFDRAEITRVYAIKGGPGTGKSRFMREVADCGEARGWYAERIYCSSDPDSLDGVILWENGKGIALLDATAPHVYEPTLPGAREEIVNLGDFWSAERLSRNADEIAELNRQKGEGYRRAYRYLSAYGNVSQNADGLLSPCVKLKSVSDFAARLTYSLPNGEKFSSRTVLMRSVGMRGQVSFDSYFAKAKKIFLIEDCRGAGYRLTEALYRCAADKRMEVLVSRDPILPDRIDGLFLVQSGYAFAVASPAECLYPSRKISTRRFLDAVRLREARPALNGATRLCSALLASAVEELDKVRQLHFRLEELYSSAMDFSAKEAFTKSFCERLFLLQSE